MELVIDGYKISYKETGDGEDTVIILQGWGTNMAVYDSVDTESSSLTSRDLGTATNPGKRGLWRTMPGSF